MKVALYEPEIPQNVGSIMRICACFGIELILIEPFSFLMTEKAFKRAKMDYNTPTEIVTDFNSFKERYSERKILFTPHSSLMMNKFAFEKNDILFFGRESNGVEIDIVLHMDACVAIPMEQNVRSLNVAICVGIVLSYLSSYSFRTKKNVTN